ncbi:4'-phosphopantetheinyl transferase superfamily protein [Pedobacter petrophilus]|uniref:4'-phosphopantetheinyl transferase superfamily protein n=1 Tax=Pedobacter petrophilus TaxID=1908241 RepID=A0A7K0G0K9_9SPHI|nr:4'-phosphopantetheinyl transferase superfamily protein [Pedobacter petrophilus]MRX77383.1 4'-phosphopantetheinyl transferase superfamily protein [Pedobacter petrophilus]
MIGNDLVDLDLAKMQSNWRRKGYLDKIFTPAEQELINTSNGADETVWILWSMKEAVYKIHNRITGVRNFAPTSLACCLTQSNDKITGLVCIGDQIYFTETTTSASYVHTIAAPLFNQLSNIVIEIYAEPNHPIDYKSLAPGCVSHHGRYLALVYG